MRVINTQRITSSSTKVTVSPIQPSEEESGGMLRPSRCVQHVAAIHHLFVPIQFLLCPQLCSVVTPDASRLQLPQEHKVMVQEASSQCLSVFSEDSVTGE